MTDKTNQNPQEPATFAQAIAEKVLVFDGAMGTELYRHHVFTNRCFDELCLTDAKLIRKIHADYRDAGADVLTTNTFGANRVELAKFGLAEQLEDIVRGGAAIARQVADEADRPMYVAGSIGPMPSQPQFEDRVEEMILEQVAALFDGGADFIMFETQPTRVALERCAAAMRKATQVPYVLSFVVLGPGESTGGEMPGDKSADAEASFVESVSGEPLERMLAPLADDCPAPVAWGMNCGTGPDGLLGAVEAAVRLTKAPLIVQPNAGMPKEVGNRRIYFCSPEYLSTYAKWFVNLGVSGIGGCCGTTPEHVTEIAKTVKSLSRPTKSPIASRSADAPQLKEPAPLSERSKLGKSLAEKQWIATVELVPPRGYNLDSTVEKSKTLLEHGVDAINVPDGPRASSRISPLITCQRILERADIEPILHFCCRDRNLIGMQADLLACAACNIRNILFVTGDPPKLGNFPDATGVFDTDSIGMTSVQHRLNCGVDLGGLELNPPTMAVIGVGLDPTTLDQDRELDRFRQKVEAGAEFAITQPVFDPDALLRFLDRAQGHGIPIMAGIWPLASYRNATFMNNEVPGVEIPDSIMQRMASVESREDQLKMGVDIARESVDRVRDRVAGIQVSAPFGKISTALSVIEGP
ncbi:MAG: bifunctional homocysteine S-methyltransferase/methylenetetrahydrofolate reductase [Planctomycetota bacterium]|nr:bifunctional homocysteine S-methyltransferase/methylenetetrahydrofolate reductase [Planctomycetota bacterium]